MRYDSTESAEVKSGEEENTRFSVSPVWTGAAADYDQPSLQYVGTGEGAQVFGWGLYGSAQEGIGRQYAEADADDKRTRIIYKGKIVKDEDLHGPEFSAYMNISEVLPNGNVRVVVPIKFRSVR